jgi:hypothetical protein
MPPAFVLPKYDLKKAGVLVEKFEARLRAQGRQSGGRYRGKLPPSTADSQAIAGACTTERNIRKGEVEFRSRCKVGCP